MASVGMFGKMLSYGDFVSVGTAAPGHQKFSRWLEGSNDALVERGLELPDDPIGFMIRHEESDSMLVGLLVGSGDNVGRSFPLGLFYEVSAEGICVAGLPQAMASDLFRLAGVVRKAKGRNHEEVGSLVRALPLPVERELAIRSHAELNRLRIVRAQMMLGRVYGEEDAPYYATEVILRACAQASERRMSAPLVLEGRVHTDIEMMFLLASIDAMSGGKQPVSAIWEVRSHRALFVLGQPDDRLLALMVGEGEAERLWPLWTEREGVARQAREDLDHDYRVLLDDPSNVHAKDFIDSTDSILGKGRSYGKARLSSSKRTYQHRL